MKTGPVIAAILTALVCGPLSSALPARRGTARLTQPDGTVFSAILRGDEAARVLTTADGCAIMKGEDGFYHYAYYSPDGERHSTGYIVGRETPGMIMLSSRTIPYRSILSSASERRRSAGKIYSSIRKKALATKASAVSRTNCLVIPAEFADKGFDYGRDYIQAMLSQEGYSYNGATGSVKEYFDAQFLGTRRFNFIVSSVVRLSKEEKYYGADSGKDIDIKACEAVVEACRAVDGEIDFSVFDNDGDGTIDNVFIIVPGKDQADCGDEDLIWSHQWFIREGSGQSVVLDGKTLDSYAISTELRRTDAKDASGDWIYGFTGIGPFCHEFGHTLGLVDMYDTDLEDSAGGGVAAGHFASTSLMDMGGYNNGSRTPPNFNAVDRDMLGTGSPQTLKAGSVTLEPVSKTGRYLRLRAEDPDEYYLIECREQSGWDRYIGGGGLGIYHIDKSGNPAGFSDAQNRVLTAKERWEEYNEVNCIPDRQCGGMVPADPSAYPFDGEGYLIPGIASRVFWPCLSYTAFTSQTNPPFEFYGSGPDPVPSPLVITDIKRLAEGVSFVVRNNTEDTPPSPVNVRYYTFQDALTVTWEANDADYYGTAFIEWTPAAGEVTTAEVSQYEKGKYSFTIEGLRPKTECRIEIFFKFGETEGPRVASSPSTNPLSGGFPYIYLNNTDRNPDGSFPAGAALPLRVFNVIGATDIAWYYGTRAVTSDLSGFFHPSSSGTLKAVITLQNGTVETIVKHIEIK